MKVMVAYVSRSGSTREIAARLAAGLEGAGHAVTLLPAAQAAELDGYDAVVAGGFLYRLGWHPELTRFLRRHRAALKEKKTALFVCGLRLTPSAAQDREAFPVFVDPALVPPAGERPGLTGWLTTFRRYLGPVLPLVREIAPAGMAFFAGSLQVFTLTPLERVTAIVLMGLTGIQPGDHRHWESVDEWAGRLPGILTHPLPPP
jgi:hypothetical protein